LSYVRMVAARLEETARVCLGMGDVGIGASVWGGGSAVSYVTMVAARLGGTAGVWGWRWYGGIWG